MCDAAKTLNELREDVDGQIRLAINLMREKKKNKQKTSRNNVRKNKHKIKKAKSTTISTKKREKSTKINIITKQKKASKKSTKKKKIKKEEEKAITRRRRYLEIGRMLKISVDDIISYDLEFCVILQPRVLKKEKIKNDYLSEGTKRLCCVTAFIYIMFSTFFNFNFIFAVVVIVAGFFLHMCICEWSTDVQSEGDYMPNQRSWETVQPKEKKNNDESNKQGNNKSPYPVMICPH